MTARRSAIRCVVLVMAGLASGWAAADFEVTGPDGRRILLKDDKTWRYVEPDAAADAKPVAGQPAGKDGANSKDVASDPKDSAAEKKNVGEALLYLDGKIDGNRTCRLQLRMVNNLRFEIRSLVPEFSILRANGVVYDSKFSGFSFIKPGDSQKREVRFNGIDCDDIARVKVGGGDRCEMGDLDKFSNAKGACLSHVRVEPSSVIRFDK
ncbi:MAG: hypothetical protein ACREUX_05510 [Burkholderiales bacterium]